MKWEYLILDDSKHGNPDSKFDLDQIGENGWDLCQVITCPVTGIRKWYFKRRKEG